jgi:transposase
MVWGTRRGDGTIVAGNERSQSSWLVAGVLPGIERQLLKKLEPSPERLLAVLHRWRDEATTLISRGRMVCIAIEHVLLYLSQDLRTLVRR